MRRSGAKAANVSAVGLRVSNVMPLTASVAQKEGSRTAVPLALDCLLPKLEQLEQLEQ